MQLYGPKPRKINALEFYKDRLTELRRLILEEQPNALSRCIPSAFVTFHKRRAQV